MSDRNIKLTDAQLQLMLDTIEGVIDVRLSWLLSRCPSEGKDRAERYANEQRLRKRIRAGRPPYRSDFAYATTDQIHALDQLKQSLEQQIEQGLQQKIEQALEQQRP
jgi:hypothetical protein